VIDEWIDGGSAYRACHRGEMGGMGQLDPRFIATDLAGSTGCPSLSPPPSPSPRAIVKRYVPAHLHTRVRGRACECAKDAAVGERGGVIGIIIYQCNLAL